MVLKVMQAERSTWLVIAVLNLSLGCNGIRK